MWKDPIDDELESHFQALKRERMEAGGSEREAERYARLKLGHSAAVREEVRSLSLPHRLEALWRHTRFAARSFRRHGGAYLLATAILALGIGLSVAMFSLVEAVVLSPLPFPNQQSVHLIWKSDSQRNGHLVGELAYPELADLRSNANVLEHVALIPAALYGNGRVLQPGTGEAVQIETCPASPDFFKVLGVTPALGRDFNLGDEGPGAAPVAILSDRVWREHFSARREAIGELVRLNGRGHRIIGVMAPEFEFPRGAGLWVPLTTTPRRGMTWLQAVVRARPGVSREAVIAAAERTFQLQVADHPGDYSRTQRAVVTPVAEFLTGSSKSQLLLSLLASLLLLLSACASAGNLFLSRTLVRRREVATRSSLGATRSQILTQFATEGFLAAAVASVLGALLAAAVIRILLRWAPADIPRIAAAGLNPAALAFAAAVALVAAVACAIGPALLLRRRNLDVLLRQGGTRTAGSRTGGRLQSFFVFAQSALTVAILAIGLLLALSYRAMTRTDIGFAHRDTLTMNLALRGQKISPEIRRRFYADLLERLRAAPQVSSAAAVLLRPLEGPIGWDTAYRFEFEPAGGDPNQLPKANFEVTTPGYFETVGTALLAGRDFSEHDSGDGEKVVVISDSLARRVRRAGHDPIGQRLAVFGELRKIVGVAADARYRRVVESGDDIYVPYRQIDVPTNYLVIRGAAPTADLLALVRKTLREIDPTQAIAGEATLGEMMERNTARNRFLVWILILFAAGAIVLAAAGIHSVIRESVTVRAKELAVKIALGAGRGRLVAQTTRCALGWVMAGEVVGLAGALLIARAAADLLYGVSPGDPIVLASVAGFVFLVAAVSSFVPAWIAAGKDPQATLQAD